LQSDSRSQRIMAATYLTLIWWLIFTFSCPVSSQFFPQRRGNILRQAAEVRKSSQSREEAVLDELVQSTFQDFPPSQDSSSGNSPVRFSSSASPAYPASAPASEEPLLATKATRVSPAQQVSQPQQTNSRGRTDQPGQARPSAGLRSPPSTFRTTSARPGDRLATPGRLSSVLPSNRNRAPAQPQPAATPAAPSRPYAVREDARPPVNAPDTGFRNFAPVNSAAQQPRQVYEPQPLPVEPAARPLGQASATQQQQQQRQQQPTRSFSNQQAGGGVRTFVPGENPLNEGREQRIQRLPQQEDFDSRQPLAQDFLPTCPDATFSYIIPSPIQCDLYYLCEFGTPSRKICDDGLVFSIEDVKCVSADREKCEGRPRLQTPKGTGPCTRRNGIFYTNDTCNEFVTCRDNHPSFGQCAAGLVFDTQQKICAWADEALRPGCLPEDLLGFRCPNPKLSKEQALATRVHLRFGDHDRFADEKDCRFFFMCLTTGQPRRAGCGNGKVFDRSTGICKAAKDVPECADYYGPAVANSRGPTNTNVQDSRLLLIQDDLSKQFQLEQQRSRGLLRSKRWILEEEAFPEGG